MRTPVIKYIRVEDNKAIIIPKAEGIDILKGALQSNYSNLDFVEGLEKVADQEIIAFIITFEKDIVFWHQHCSIFNNTQNLYFYMGDVNDKVYITLDMFVKESKIV